MTVEEAPFPVPAARTPAGPPVILMYHRVEHLACDPWMLGVSPENFRKQIEYLSSEREIVPLRQLVAQMREGRLKPGSVAITFDDGYSDFLRNAFPVLEELGCPATLFLVTDALDRPGYWWDVLGRIVMETPSLPHSLTFDIAGTEHRFQIAGDDGASLPETTSAERVTREELHYSLWKHLKPLAEPNRRVYLEALAEWAGVDPADREGDRILRTDEVRTLARSPLIEIGAHTRSHASLPLLDDTLMFDEILGSRAACEALSGKPVSGFTYPFGDIDDRCPAVVASLGFEYACTTIGGRITETSNPLLLPRPAVGDWDEEEFRNRLKL